MRVSSTKSHWLAGLRTVSCFVHASSTFDIGSDSSYNEFANTLNTGTTFWNEEEDPPFGIISDDRIDYHLAFESIQRTYLNTPGINHTESIKVLWAHMFEDATFDWDVKRASVLYLIAIDYFDRYRRFASTEHDDLALIPTYAKPRD